MDGGGFVARCPGFSEWLGRPGFPIPMTDKMLRFCDDAEGIAVLSSFGIFVRGGSGSNRIWVEPPVKPYDLTIDFSSSVDSLAVIECCIELHGAVTAVSNSTVVLMSGHFTRIDALLDGALPGLYIGPGAYVGGMHCWVQSHHNALMFGEDLMTGWDISVRTSDFHGIFDIQTGATFNEPASTIVGPHVWLAPEVMIMRGIEVGAGSIVGARAVVSHDVPAQALAVGVPARIVRTGVSWVRPLTPSPDMIRDIMERSYMGTPPGDGRPLSRPTELLEA